MADQPEDLEPLSAGDRAVPAQSAAGRGEDQGPPSRPEAPRAPGEGRKRPLAPPPPSDREVTPAISLGCGANRPNGNRHFLLGDWAADIADAIAAHRGIEAWWSPHTWKGDRRDSQRWQAAIGVGLDLDCDNHGVLAEDLGRAAIEALRNSFNLLHVTPHGIRAVVVFDRRVTDAELYSRCARGVAALASGKLAEHRIVGLQVDPAPTEDRARLLFTPTADVKCRHEHPECVHSLRKADVLIARVEGWDPDVLAQQGNGASVRVAIASPPEFTIDGPGDVADALLRSGYEEGKSDITFRCPLPAHEDKHPSARFSRVKGKWYCDVCRKGGSWKRLAVLLGLTPARRSGPRRGTATRPLGDGRKVITYRTPAGDVPLHVIVPQAIAAVASSCPCAAFSRGGRLVRANSEGPFPSGKIARGTGMRVAPIPDGALRELVGSAVQWFSIRESRSGEQQIVETWTPPAVLNAVRDRGEWEGIHTLTGVIEAPSVRPDGSLIDRPGYDEATGLLLCPHDSYPRVPDSPTAGDVVTALMAITKPFREFPLQLGADRASLVALMLTIAARPWVSGCVPHWLVLAPTFGAGKSLLVNAATIAMTGVTPDMMAPVGGRGADAEAEMRKRITALVLEASRVAVIDNLHDGTTFESKAFAALLTATRWKDRVLGRSESISLPHDIVWVSTGCNVRLWGDLARRSLSIEIDPCVEEPHRRTFEIEDLTRLVRETHPQLLVSALTIVRGFIAAGMPRHGSAPLGMFEEWDRRVRSAVIWATGLQGQALDPLDTAARLQAEAPDRAALGELLEAWSEALGEGEVVTARELVEHSRLTVRLREAALGIARDKNGELDARALGNRLRVLAGQVRSGLRLQRYGSRQGSTLWQVVRAVGRGSGGSRESLDVCVEHSGAPAPTRARENSDTASTGSTGSSTSTDSPDSYALEERAAIQAEAEGSVA